jgi:nucleotide-binding universal stress UspA family protein
MDQPSPTPGVVVVGVDGSLSCRYALRFACEEALRRGVGVEVVTAWQAAPVLATASGQVRLQDDEGVAQMTQDRIVREVTESLPETPPISQRLVHGHGGAALVEASRDAGVLVVGRTSRRRPAQIVSGLVGSECLRRSSVPVILVPAPEESVPRPREALSGPLGAALPGVPANGAPSDPAPAF